MADLDDEAVIVTLPAEEGGATVTKVEGEGDGKKTVADDPIADLKGQFDSLRDTHQTVVQRLTTTEQQLAATKEEVTKARGEVTSSQLDTVLSGIQAATSEADAAEREYIAAAEAGDFAAQARAQRKISGAEARIQRLTEAKGDDVDGYLKLLRAKHPEWSDLAIIHVSTPDFKDAFQDGWAKATDQLEELMKKLQS